jgi:CubicO group peptidase (beta-lactamase class C family)
VWSRLLEVLEPTMRRLLGMSVMIAVTSLAATPTDAEVKQLLEERLAARGGVGLVVGIIDASGKRVIVAGTPEVGSKDPLTGQTVFEIGSVTKVFTSLVLAQMVEKKELALTDPVSKFLPKEKTLKVPTRDGKDITLADLATQTSGLPRLPTNLAPKDDSNPYADYTAQRLYDFLSDYQLPRTIGSTYEYSNLGVGLLGHALSRKAGVDFDHLVKARITGALKLTSTAVALTPAMKQRLAPGHDEALKPAANWDFDALAGCGALRSTADDLLTFLSAELGYTRTPLAGTMAAQLAPRRPTELPNTEIALGWHVTTTPTSQRIWHNGGTGGYQSYVGFDPKTKVGVVVLSNAATQQRIDDLGVHLLDPTVPVSKPSMHTEITLTPAQLEAFPGRYAITPQFVLTVTHEGEGLFVQATGQGKIPVFAESPRRFFARMVDAQVTFDADVGGKASGLTLHQGGNDTPAKRVGDAPAVIAHQTIVVDQKVLETYVGRYVVSPAFALTITRDGTRLFLQATNQPKLELFAEQPNRFFVKEVEAVITFGDQGLVLHQNGADVPAKRER